VEATVYEWIPGTFFRGVTEKFELADGAVKNGTLLGHI
jgi:hypothetical protein